MKSKTKVIGTITITTQVKLSASDKKVNEEPFVIYLSGNDGYGPVSSNGRSDVNILAASILKPVRYCLFRHRVITISQLKMLPESLVLIN